MLKDGSLLVSDDLAGPRRHAATTTALREADVIVAKHRNGPTADIVLGFQGHYARFSNLAKDSGGF